MKRHLFLFVFTFLQVVAYSKKHQTASFYVVPPAGNEKPYYSWSINGNAIDEKIRCTLSIHYPDFDTIILSHGTKTRMIITSLKKGHVYELNHGDWHDDVSMRDMTDHMKQTHRRNLTHSSKTIKVIFSCHNAAADTLLAGTFGWIRQNFTNGKVLREHESALIEDNELKTSRGYFYDIRIGKGTLRREIDIYNDSRFLNFNYDEERVFVFDEQLISFEYKFFESSTLYVDYDHKLKKVRLSLK